MMTSAIARRIKSESSEESDIDITPMLDVVFIMLIFFIVTASFVKESGFGLNKPNNSPPATVVPSIPPIVLEISEIDEVRIQNRLILHSAIRATLVRLQAESPDAAIVVRLHPQVTTKTMVGAIDQVRAANVPLPAVSLIEI